MLCYVANVYYICGLILRVRDFHLQTMLPRQHLWSMILLMSRLPGGHSRYAGRWLEKLGCQQSTTNGLRTPMLSAAWNQLGIQSSYIQYMQIIYYFTWLRV